jgi:hypothetical protein
MKTTKFGIIFIWFIGDEFLAGVPWRANIFGGDEYFGFFGVLFSFRVIDLDLILKCNFLGWLTSVLNLVNKILDILIGGILNWVIGYKGGFSEIFRKFSNILCEIFMLIISDKYFKVIILFFFPAFGL